jgi:hypothetical protein
MNMIEARRKLNAALADHPSVMEYMLFGVTEDGFGVVAIAEMEDQTDIVVGFDLPGYVDPDDADARHRLRDAFLRSTIAAVPGA